ncbi:class I SAM-dependent RNA methyltransferase [Craurococcus roseus]|uniref:Class I SAM-dependent RNA methyltransferase n=1 Tax=Craurococcus roseus TaxID=77585 RepID=A0ABN1FCY3_9PROT
MELAVTALGAAGDGLARMPDGGPCFVPRSLPGETLAVRDLGKRGGGRLAEPEAVLRASPDRVEPPCPHFAACGGCALQHWADVPYAEWKHGKLVEALSRAGFAEVPVAPLVRTPPRARRRADLALRRRPDGRVALGFHARVGRTVLDLQTCEVLDPRLVSLFGPLRDLLRGLPALRREGSAVVNLLDTGPDLLLRTDGALDAPARAKLAAFAAAHGVPRVAWALGDRAPEVAAQHGPAAIRFGGAAVHPPPGAFLQASPAGEAATREAVLAGLPERLPGRAAIAELHAGVGTLSFALAERARVNAYEASVGAVGALEAAAGRAGARIKAVRRDLVRQPLLPAELKPFAAVVLDPPFGGAPEQVPLLARGRVPRVVYVSCNPAALAQDAKTLKGAGYRVVSAVPVDQFLWSPHLEAVVAFAL